ncbi:MAG: hypothetical protein KatS3mg115_1090 [Candidatus Poribacteria bacterium]|nr:MAG: hypothetical protein KatS3mg115_1090 [Candidatus Poribacteria bacterium]
MRAMRWFIVGLLIAWGAVWFGGPVQAAETQADLEKIVAAIDRGLAWLTTQRDERGAWRSDYGPGITALVVTAYLRHPESKYPRRQS